MMDFFKKLGEAFLVEAEVFIDFMPRLIIALLVASAAYLAGKLIASAMVRILKRSNMPATYYSYFSKLVKAIALFIGVILFLNVIGYGTLAASLVAGGGLTAVMLGFAFKDIGENFLAGFFLAFSRPFHENDLIETGGIMGTVKGIHLRHTHLRTGEGCDVFVPSAQLFTKPLHNYTLDGLRRGNFTIGIEYTDDIEKALGILSDTAREARGVLASPAPAASVKTFLQEYAELQVTFWIQTKNQELNLARVRSQVMNLAKNRLIEAGFTLSSGISTSVSLTPTTVHISDEGSQT